jgi:hypothetical protein
VSIARWIFALPLAVVIALLCGISIGGTSVLSVEAQAFITPMIFIFTLSLITPPAERMVTSACILAATVLAVAAVVPLSVVFMLHAGISASALNETSCFEVGGALTGATLAILYTTTIKSKPGKETE